MEALVGGWLGISCLLGGGQLLSFAPLIFLGFYFPLSLAVLFLCGLFSLTIFEFSF